MFGPMLADLARQHGFSLAEDAISGCSWVSGLDNLNVHASPATKKQCVDKRGEWYADVLPKLKPDVVLMVQRPREGVTRPVGLMAKSKGSEPQLDLLTKSLDQTLGVVTDGPWKVLLLESVLTPRPFRVAPCLSAARTVGQCPVPLPRDAVQRRAVPRCRPARPERVHRQHQPGGLPARPDLPRRTRQDSCVARPGPSQRRLHDALARADLAGAGAVRGAGRLRRVGDSRGSGLVGTAMESQAQPQQQDQVDDALTGLLCPGGAGWQRGQESAHGALHQGTEHERRDPLRRPPRRA